MKKLVLLAACMVATGVLAEEAKPFQASLIPDIAIHSRDTRINGVALSIWGENPQSAFALGFVNGSTGDSKGFSLGLVNYTENYKGVHWGIVNYASGEFVGWQAGFVSIAEDMGGIQTSYVNYAHKLKGLQLGLVNYAQTTETAIQLGLVNIIAENEKWFSNFPDEVAPGMVIVNWRFP